MGILLLGMGMVVELFDWFMMIMFGKRGLPKRGSILFKGTAWMRISGRSR